MPISELITIILAFISLSLAIWLIPIYRKMAVNEKLIRTKEDEIDAVEQDINGRVSGSLVNESQRQALVENAKKPLERQLERLRQERQFLIDRLPFFRK